MNCVVDSRTLQALEIGESFSAKRTHGNGRRISRMRVMSSVDAPVSVSRGGYQHMVLVEYRGRSGYLRFMEDGNAFLVREDGTPFLSDGT